VKKLDKPLAILKRSDGEIEENRDGKVRVMGVIGWKVVFSARPEPVGEESIG